ncbi:Protein CBG04431 [Caenorhabditis briggsae]|uniref:Flavin-containing monooxygenase n=1 Tax=Caenorhabditis briggsae TaxID=6238 RepID=A8WXJ0_CAEBR|nr:Protein CBG04431 [Caenorhabditis briggsae]CAP25130.1 Protein CBG04431 [Caenorhabditis briggsae]
MYCRICSDRSIPKPSTLSSIVWIPVQDIKNLSIDEILDHRGYEDKTVVVIGIGNSGGDVAVELSRIAKQVYLVTRRGTWVFNRIFDYGKPIDMVMNRKWISDIRARVPEWLSNSVVEMKLNMRFDHQAYGLKPAHRVFGAHPTVNDELPNRIACGTVRIKPNIANFTEHGVVFEDGSKLDQVDEVVMSTGFSFEFNLVEEGKLIQVQDNHVSLYQYMFPTDLADQNTLAVIGLVQPFGSIMPLSEMQARVYLEQFTGNNVIPSKREMMENVHDKLSKMASRYVTSKRHTIQVDYVDYIEELAKMIGAQLDMKKLWKEDPWLAYKVYFGPRVPYIYRLNGPHKWKEARDAIMSVDERVLMATNDHAQVAPDYTVLYFADWYGKRRKTTTMKNGLNNSRERLMNHGEKNRECSRGFINGKLEQKFIQETCDEGMLYCIESYTGDFDEVTASCQHLGTNMRLLDLCQSKNPKKINEDLTTRCCKTDLCNNIGVEKKKLKKIEN